MDKAKLKTGTTTVGLVCADGIVLAADKRATAGHFAVHKKIDKVFKITDKIALTTSGSVSDCDKLVQLIRAELALYKLEHGIEPTVDVAATLLSNIAYGQAKSFFPYIISLIVGGASDKGYRLYNVFLDGSAIKDDFIATGSGMEIAYGVLDANYSAKMSVESGIKLAVKAIQTALKRDVYSGDGLDVVVIDSNGFRKLSKQEIEKLL